MSRTKKFILLAAAVLVFSSIVIAVLLLSRTCTPPDPYIGIIDLDHTGYGDELLDALRQGTADYGYITYYFATVKEGRVTAEVDLSITSREKQDAIDALWELLRVFGQYDNDQAGKLTAMVWWNPNRWDSNELQCHIDGWIGYKAASRVDWNQGSEGLYGANYLNRYADEAAFGEAWTVIIDFPPYQNIAEECE